MLEFTPVNIIMRAIFDYGKYEISSHSNEFVLVRECAAPSISGMSCTHIKQIGRYSDIQEALDAAEEDCRKILPDLRKRL